jgi:hypothetical protein
LDRRVDQDGRHVLVRLALHAENITRGPLDVKAPGYPRVRTMLGSQAGRPGTGRR